MPIFVGTNETRSDSICFLILVAALLGYPPADAVAIPGGLGNHSASVKLAGMRIVISLRYLNLLLLLLLCRGTTFQRNTRQGFFYHSVDNRFYLLLLLYISFLV